jgi:hypothetical protein
VAGEQLGAKSLGRLVLWGFELVEVRELWVRRIVLSQGDLGARGFGGRQS